MPSDRVAVSSPAMIPLSAPRFGGREWAYLKGCLDSGWVSSASPLVEQFEQAIARRVGAPHAVAVASGTAALHVALQVAGVQPDDEVLVPALTFIAPVNAIRYCRAHPVFVDADPETWQMRVGPVARFLAQGCERRGEGCYNRRTGRRVRALLPVHLLGLSGAMDQWVALAREYGLAVVEDAAEGIGVRYQGRHVGTWGDVGILSFNGNKTITCGGGGMLLTANPEAAARARYLTTQAKDDPLESFHREVGYNYRLPGLQAALGLAQLEQLDGFLAAKRALAAEYGLALRGVPGVSGMPTPPDTEAAYWLYTVLLPEGTTIARRRAIVAALRRRGVEARPLWCPAPLLPPYADCQTLGLDMVHQLHARAVSLPSSVGLTREELATCVAALRQAMSDP